MSDGYYHATQSRHQQFISLASDTVALASKGTIRSLSVKALHLNANFTVSWHWNFPCVWGLGNRENEYCVYPFLMLTFLTISFVLFKENNLEKFQLTPLQQHFINAFGSDLANQVGERRKNIKYGINNNWIVDNNTRRKRPPRNVLHSKTSMSQNGRTENTYSHQPFPSKNNIAVLQALGTVKKVFVIFEARIIKILKNISVPELRYSDENINVKQWRHMHVLLVNIFESFYVSLTTWNFPFVQLML